MFTRSGLRKLHPFLFSWLSMILFSLRAPLFAEQLLTFAQLLMFAECRSRSAARALSFLLFYPPSSPWFLRTLVAKTSNTFQGSLYVVRFSRDGVSGDLFETRPSLGVMCYFSSPRMESRGIGFNLKRSFWLKGSKGLYQLSSLCCSYRLVMLRFPPLLKT